jgi:hypothetical protein
MVKGLFVKMNSRLAIVYLCIWICTKCYPWGWEVEYSIIRRPRIVCCMDAGFVVNTCTDTNHDRYWSGFT